VAADALMVVAVLERKVSQEYAARLADSFMLCEGVCSTEVMTADQVSNHYAAKTQARVETQGVLLELLRAVARDVPLADIQSALEQVGRR